jgi:LAS superfamily LD-carboxypeptidase LdcB
MDNNNWLGKPGVPLNPERWRGAINDALTNWLSPIEDHETPADALQRLIRLEVDAALDPKVSQSAADLVAQAKRDALEKCISICDVVIRANRVEYPEKWKDRPEGIPHDWQQAWETSAETAEDIAADIRALEGERDE